MSRMRLCRSGPEADRIKSESRVAEALLRQRGCEEMLISRDPRPLPTLPRERMTGEVMSHSSFGMKVHAALQTQSSTFAAVAKRCRIGARTLHLFSKHGRCMRAGQSHRRRMLGVRLSRDGLAVLISRGDGGGDMGWMDGWMEAVCSLQSAVGDRGVVDRREGVMGQHFL